MEKIWNFLKTSAKFIFWLTISVLLPTIAFVLITIGYEIGKQTGDPTAFSFGEFIFYLLAWFVLAFYGNNYHRINKNIYGKKTIAITYAEQTNTMYVCGPKELLDATEVKCNYVKDDTLDKTEVDTVKLTY